MPGLFGPSSFGGVGHTSDAEEDRDVDFDLPELATFGGKENGCMDPHS